MMNIYRTKKKDLINLAIELGLSSPGADTVAELRRRISYEMYDKNKESTMVKTNQPAPAGMKLVSEGSLESLAENVSTVAQAVRRMDGIIERRAFVALIQEYAPARIGQSVINLVLDTAADLDKIKKKK